MRGADVDEAERLAMEARARATAAAVAANASAKKVFDEVVTSAKFKLKSLQAHADSIQRDY
jgi:chorismate synthase